MIQFIQDMPTNPLLLTGLIAGLLASIACGAIGPFVVTRRIVFLSGAIAHMAVGGLGAAIFLAAHFPQLFGWLKPMHGALIAAVLAAVLIAVVYERVTERMDTLIGAMWAVGMSIGILLIKYTPGYHTDLMSFLFGNIVYVTWSQIWLMTALDIVIIGCVCFMHKQLLAVCIDEEQAELQGVHVFSTHLILLILVALTVICLIKVVGLVLVIALLSLPAATAAHHLSRLVAIQWGAILLCILLTTVPRMAVYGTRMSPESAIVLAAGGVYLISVIIRRVRAARA
ncbi:MAG: metal ABC transporter permease [Planctomycetes bacterium]|nr:metal ABC transporter permease [Planctomycetota bacterium]NOG55607.1 metal ABC transporter permease [Planctomycetota bacterium]